MSFRSLARGIAGVISNISCSQPSPGILIRPLGRNMSGKEESEEGVEGSEGDIVEKGEDESSTHPHLPPFTLLLHILQSNGLPVPTVLFMATNTAKLVREVTGTLPVSVNVVTNREAIVSLEEGVLAVRIAQQLQGSLVWGPHHTEVTCLLSSKDSILKIGKIERQPDEDWRNWKLSTRMPYQIVRDR